MIGFNEIYEEVYKECNDSLENKRIAVKNYQIISFIIFIGLGVFLAIMYKYPVFVFIGIMIWTLIIGFSKKSRQYNSEFKNNVIKKFVKSYCDTLTYSPERGISSQIYREAEFEHYDRYSSEDYISGILEDGYAIEMAEVHTEDESTDKDGHTTYTTIFYGLFARVSFDKAVFGTIKIRKNKLKLFGNKDRIEMDSGEFEKIYDVYADDKIIAMQLLTADIMQMFIDFKNKYKISPELTIRQNKLYIRFATGNVFEANVLKRALDYDTLKKYYDTINFTLRITEKMLKNIKETEL